MSVAKGDGNHGEGRHRRVVLWGLDNGPKRGEKLKTGGSLKQWGKHPKKWGNHQNLGIEALKVSGNSDILMVNQKIYHNMS